MKKILFTGGGGAGTEALYDILKNKCEVHFADANKNSEAIPDAVDLSNQHEVPYASSPKFKEEIVKLINKLEIELLIPGVDEELYSFDYIEKNVSGIEILCPDSDYINLMIDKKTMSEALESKKIPSPGAINLNNTDELIFPMFVKPRKGRGSRGAQRVDNHEDLLAYLQLSKITINDLVGQTYLNGIEFTVMMSANKLGELCAIVPVKIYEKRGITIHAEVVNDEVVTNLCKKIHESYPAKGCYNIQLMKISDNEAIPFEINPRISTTFCMSLAAGIDPIHNYYLEGVSKKIQNYKVGVTLRRYWHNKLS